MIAAASSSVVIHFFSFGNVTLLAYPSMCSLPSGACCMSIAPNPSVDASVSSKVGHFRFGNASISAVVNAVFSCSKLICSVSCYCYFTFSAVKMCNGLTILAKFCINFR